MSPAKGSPPWFLAGLLIGCLAGCAEQDMSDLMAYAQQVRGRLGGRVEPLPQIETRETFVYVAGARRDPFAPSESLRQPAAEVVNGVRPNPQRPREQLESFPLDSLRMVGGLTRGRTVWALVKGADGKVYPVQAGNYIGQNHGRIDAVTEMEIKLTEIVADGKSGWRERLASLVLGK